MDCKLLFVWYDDCARFWSLLISICFLTVLDLELKTVNINCIFIASPVLKTFLNYFVQRNGFTMNFDKTISELLSVDGALAAAVVDYSSGMLLAGGGSSNVDLEIAAAGNTEVMRAKMKTMGMLGLNDIIDDILITLGEQYHLLRPL